jgi:DoxX-like family
MRNSDLKLMRYTLALIWLITSLLSAGIYPIADSLALLEKVGFSGDVALLLLFASTACDFILGLLTLIRPSKILWQIQAVLIVLYSLIIAAYLPIYWLHPFAPVLKNLAILMLLWLLHQYSEAR